MATNPKSIIPNIRVSLGKPVSVPCAVMCESQQTTARLVGRRGSSAVVVGGRFSTAVVVITRRPRGVGCYGSREWDVSGDVSVGTVFVAHIAGDGGLCKKWSNPSILAGGQVLRRAVVAVGDQGYGRGGTPIFTGVFEPLARVALYPTDKDGLGTRGLPQLKSPLHCGLISSM